MHFLTLSFQDYKMETRYRESVFFRSFPTFRKNMYILTVISLGYLIYAFSKSEYDMGAIAIFCSLMFPLIVELTKKYHGTFDWVLFAY